MHGRSSWNLARAPTDDGRGTPSVARDGVGGAAGTDCYRVSPPRPSPRLRRSLPTTPRSRRPAWRVSVLPAGGRTWQQTRLLTERPPTNSPTRVFVSSRYGRANEPRCRGAKTFRECFMNSFIHQHSLRHQAVVHNFREQTSDEFIH